MNLKSPAAPLILLVLAFLTLVNLVIHASILLTPHLHKALVATLKLTKALLQTAFASLEKVGTESIYYFYPVLENNVLDTLVGALLSDLGTLALIIWMLTPSGCHAARVVIAYLGKAGMRICE